MDNLNTILIIIIVVLPCLVLFSCLYKLCRKYCAQRPAEERQREARLESAFGPTERVSSASSRRPPTVNRPCLYTYLPDQTNHRSQHGINFNTPNTIASRIQSHFTPQYREPRAVVHKPTLNIRRQNVEPEIPWVHGRREADLSGPKEVKVNVIEVPDGDGVKAFDVGANEILDVRLIGIDAPEMKGRQPFALEAKRYLERLVLRKSAILTKYDLDQYERVLGNLRVPGEVENVSLEMLKAGLACVYAGQKAEYGGLVAEFYRAQNLAKKKKLGMWSLDNVELPGEFKKRQRSRSQQRSHNQNRQRSPSR